MFLIQKEKKISVLFSQQASSSGVPSLLGCPGFAWSVFRDDPAREQFSQLEQHYQSDQCKQLLIHHLSIPITFIPFKYCKSRELKHFP